MKITIDKEIRKITPEFYVGVMTCNVTVFNNNKLDVLICELEEKINNEISIKDVVNLDVIIDGRNAYKAYGKDPSRYRLATESLYRRLSKGNKLYRINNIVDLGNVLSIKTRKSVAVLDSDQIKGDVHIRLGKTTDEYVGIGRGSINVENIPLYEDAIGPFGSVTSDTERTMITDNTTSVLIFIISFSGKAGIYEELDYARKLYEQYGNAEDFDLYVL